MDEKTIISLTAILCVTILEIVAVIKGLNGAIFLSAFALIGGIVGYELKLLKDKIIK